MAKYITGFQTSEGEKQYDYNALGNLPASVTDVTNTVISPNADYAEVGEWADGNPRGEDRLGYFVAVANVGDNTIKIRKATSVDDVRGVAVYNPAFSGNASADKYGEDGELLPKYNYIGVMGIVKVIDNGRCKAQGRCMPADDGTAIPSTNNMGYAVLERVDATHVLIAVEPGADMVQRIKEDIVDVVASHEVTRNNIARIDNNVARLKNGEIDRLAKTEKRVTNLESAVYGDLAREVVDDSVAYTKPVPAAAKPYARVDMIGGMTRKCENLCSFGDISATNFPHIRYLTVPAGTYTISLVANSTDTDADTCRILLKDVNGESYFWACERGVRTSKTVTLTAALSRIEFDASANSTMSAGDTAKFTNIMLNAGTTALPYEPYFEGLRSAKVESVESVGVNLFDVSKAIDTVWSGSNIQRNGNDLVFTYGTSRNDYFAFSVWVDVEPNTNYFVSLKATSIRFCYVYTDELMGSLVTSFSIANGVFNSGNNSKLLIGFYSVASSRAGTSETISNIMLNKGTTALPYRPYVKHTLPIPAEVRAKPWYGPGISKDVCNAIRYNEDGSRSGDVRCGVVDLGTLDWSLYEDSALGISYFYSGTTLPRKHGSGLNSLVCAPYDAVSNRTQLKEKCIAPYNEINNGNLCVKDSRYTDAATFKAAMQGVMLVYELATPTTEDISDILPADNYIGVEGGGTLTFVNEYGYDVPSEVVFVTKEGAV